MFYMEKSDMRIETPDFTIVGTLKDRIKKGNIELIVLSINTMKEEYAIVRMAIEPILYKCKGKELVERISTYEGDPNKAKETTEKTISNIKSRYYIKSLKKYRPGFGEEIQKVLSSNEVFPMVVWGGINIIKMSNESER